jgi:phosphoribosylamine--glycine ligase
VKVCVVGSGGREHALAWAAAREGHEVVVTPGNAGNPWSTPAPPGDVEADLYLIGPEQPLVEGLADRLRAAGRRVFGPGADGARLEGSKAWMKQVLAEAGVPTARYGAFTDEALALAFLGSLGPPFVVKTDGLAAGKGVLVTDDRAEAAEDLRAKLAGTSFGAAGTTVVIEEGLRGPELSVLAVCDGRRAVALAPARDHKRVGAGDTGPNTGGMGAYAPVPGVDTGTVLEEAVLPTLAALRQRGIDYRGVLYAGLMLTADGPKVLEYNVRFGDPEAQAVVPVTDGLVDLLASAADGRLGDGPAGTGRAAVAVVCAAEGYPGAVRTGDPVEGLDEAGALDGVEVFCGGVGRGPDGRLVTAGGRVLTVTGVAGELGEARDLAYAAAGRLSWPGLHLRADIAADAGALLSRGR